MSKESGSVPDELAEWLAGELETIGRQLRASRTEMRTHQEDAERLTLGMLHAATDIEQSARRMIHLLTVYGLRSQVTTATPMARACGVTVSSVTSRAGSRLAQQTWNEVWPTSNG